MVVGDGVTVVVLAVVCVPVPEPDPSVGGLLPSFDSSLLSFVGERVSNRMLLIDMTLKHCTISKSLVFGRLCNV